MNKHTFALFAATLLISITGYTSDSDFARVFATTDNPDLRKSALEQMHDDRMCFEAISLIAKDASHVSTNDISKLYGKIKDQALLGMVLTETGENAAHSKNTDNFKKLLFALKSDEAIALMSHAAMKGPLARFKNEIQRAQENIHNAKKQRKKVARQVMLSQTNFTPYLTRALGSNASDDEKNLLLGNADTDDKIIIGMTINDLSQTLGKKLKSHDRSSTRFYTTFSSGQTDLELYTANNILTYINRLPCDISPTYSYSLLNDPYKIWVHGHVIAISGKKFSWTLEGTYNFTGIETRLPCSFFSLEGMRLGMMKHEAEFVKEFVWPFYDECKDHSHKTLPSYKKSALHAIFPSLTLDWSDWMRSFYGPDSQPVDIDLWNDQIYWIARHYSKDETKKVGGYAGLTKRLTEKLGCAAQKKNNPASANDWGRPSIKPLNFDIRFDPCLTWELQEKDIRVELREIHSYDKTTVPVEPDKIACDLIISSLSLIRAKENQKKAAAESVSAGF